MSLQRLAPTSHRRNPEGSLIFTLRHGGAQGELKYGPSDRQFH